MDASMQLKQVSKKRLYCSELLSCGDSDEEEVSHHSSSQLPSNKSVKLTFSSTPFTDLVLSVEAQEPHSVIQFIQPISLIWVYGRFRSLGTFEKWICSEMCPKAYIKTEYPDWNKYFGEEDVIIPKETVDKTSPERMEMWLNPNTPKVTSRGEKIDCKIKRIVIHSKKSIDEYFERKSEETQEHWSERRKAWTERMQSIIYVPKPGLFEMKKGEAPKEIKSTVCYRLIKDSWSEF